ncbi:uncharacterized protein [Rutidosis leptorrhynchoides]|uniref:uncharacterized protein n=1 Tax=Rutidosis leptorrhynchoides TaxID=125765 RepID=UPI003A9961A8
MSDTSKIHPAITVNNIKNFIPITLEMEKSPYSFWSGLFKNHCRAYEVLDHIIPATTDASSSVTQTSPPPAQTPSWERLDAIVLQWIYGTISLDLLRTVFKEESTAQQAWDRLKGMFEDNKNSRAVHLQHQFANTRIDNFPDASSYCQELKILADQLGNVGPAIEEDRLVLQLVTGLNESYASLRSIITHREKLPSFYEARSMLILEETHAQKLATQAASTDATALVSSTGATNQPPYNNSSNRSSTNRGRGVYRGNRGRQSSGNRGRGRSYSGTFNSGFNSGRHTAGQFSPWNLHNWAWNNNNNWALPLARFPLLPGHAHHLATSSLVFWAHTPMLIMLLLCYHTPLISKPLCTQ